MPTFINTLQLSNMGIQGLRIYVRLRNTDGAAWIDLGNIENLTPNRDTTESTIESARNGARQVVKTLSSSITDTFTFDSLDVTDPTIVAIHEGSDGIPVLGQTGQTIIIRQTGAKKEVEFAVLEPGAPDTDSKLLYVPRAQIEGTGSTASNGGDPGRISFRTTLLTDEAYEVPAAVIASTPAAPNGLVGLLENGGAPIAELHTLLDAVAQPLDAEEAA